MRKKVLGIAVIVVIIFVGVYISGKDKSFTNKTINYNGTDLLVSIDGKDSDTLPSSGTYYLSSYKCSSSKTKVSWNKNNYTLSVSNGTSKGGVACNLEFSSKMLLSRVKAGSYVKYTGNNGCSGNACLGYNANYVSDTDMGYCHSPEYKFIVNGWRVAYISDGTAYLVSAGAPECMCTSSDGTVGISCDNYENTNGAPMHLANLNNEALKYCNSDYAYGGVCDSSSTWAMNANDFQKITGSFLSNSSCYVSYSNMSCGYNNDLIDNGGVYWYATPYNSASSANVFDWDPPNRFVYNYASDDSCGLRPVLRLQSSVYVTGGSGTYEDPYIISNS